MKIIQKYWFIFLLLLLFVIFIPNDSYATFTFTGSDGEVHEVPDLETDMMDYYMISVDSNNYYDILYGSSPIVVNSYGYLRCETGTTYRKNVKSGGTSWNTASMWNGHAPAASCNILYANHDIVDVSTEEVFFTSSLTPSFTAPYIANTVEYLATGDFDYFLIFPGSLSQLDGLGLKIAKINTISTDTDNDGVEEEYETYEFIYKSQLEARFMKWTSDEYWYEVPISELGFAFSNDITYVVQLVNDVDEIIYSDTYVLYEEITFTVTGLTEEQEEEKKQEAIISSTNKQTEKIEEQTNKIEEQTNKIEEQTEAIQEQTEVNKNIFEKIGDILSYINPFSENFFVYKLIELLVDALKALFVPSEDFFSNWLDNVNTYFGETFGILYYPFELLIDFLNRIDGIAETNTAIISVPSFTLSFMGHSVEVFKDMSFDFNTILENETFKTIHDIYLIFTDIILWLGLVYLASKCIGNILGGMGHEAIINEEEKVKESQEAEKSYQRYVRGKENQKRYNEEIRQGKRRR